jgi:hypothetical protein
MNFFLKYTWLFIILFLLSFNSEAQVAIKGPTCVLPDIPVQYNITGNWDSTSSMQICLIGGRVTDSSFVKGCSQSSAPLASIIVIWNNQSNLSISISSSKGNAFIQVNVTSSLQGGFINDSSKLQSINNGITPKLITCSNSNGGSCSPNYNYQWQQSFDAMNWNDIPGATNQNLKFDSTISQSAFYRRKVFENGSGTIAYSDMAIIDIIPNAPN